MPKADRTKKKSHALLKAKGHRGAMRAPVQHFSKEKDERFMHVVDLMLDHKWNPRSFRDLAKAWSVHPDTVQDYAHQASRFIRLAHGSEDEIRNRILLGIDQGISLALASEYKTYDQMRGKMVTHREPDLQNLHRFLHFMAEVHGVIGGPKVDKTKKTKSEEPTATYDVTAEIREVAGALGFELVPKNGVITAHVSKEDETEEGESFERVDADDNADE